MAKHYLVVDVGGTKILAAVISGEGEIISRFKLRTERSARDRLLNQLDEALSGALAGAQVHAAEVGGIALGVPGVVDSARGHVVYTPNTPLSDTPLREHLARRWKVPIIVGNDVNVGMAGEVWKGAARGAHSAFGIFVGTGIGGGLYINGSIIEGFRGLGAEIGHLMIPLGADELAGLSSKKHLFLEDLCSRTAIENQLRHAIFREGKRSILTEIVSDKKLERIRSGALKEALKKGDPLVTDVMRRASHMLGLTAASVLHIVDPQIIVFGGGVVEACGKWMLPWIARTVEKTALAGTGAPVEIVESSLGDDAILYGALHLLLEAQKKPGLAPPPADTTPIYSAVDKPSSG